MYDNDIYQITDYRYAFQPFSLSAYLAAGLILS